MISKRNDMLSGKFTRSVSLLSWMYNEERLIREYLEKVTALLDATVEDYEIILIDDCSTDRTNEIASAFARNNPKIRVLRNEKNMNVGYSSRRAIQEASKDYLFWQTVDWCYDISGLRSNLEYLNSYDIVQGVRRRPVDVKIGLLKPLAGLWKLFGIKHLTKRSDTIPKAVVSLVNYILIRILFRVPLSDFQNVTFYPTKWIQSIKFETKSSFANPEGLIKSYWSGKSIKEVAISFIPRKMGVAKGTTPKAIFSSVADILSLWFKWVLLGRRGKITKGNIFRLGCEEMAEA